MAFPSPAQDYTEKSLSLDELCIQHPAATFFVRAVENSYRSGLFHGSILVVDRSLKPVDGSIVIVELAGEFAVRRFKLYPRRGLELLDEPGRMTTVPDSDDVDGLQCWGVVTYAINDMSTGEWDDCPGM